MENDIMAERLKGLYKSIDEVNERKYISAKTAGELEEIAMALNTIATDGDNHTKTLD